MKGKLFVAFLLLLIISIAITVFAIQDSKAPEVQPEVPLTTEAEPDIQDQTLSTPAFDKLVSATFDNVPLSDVMHWLTQEGVQLAADTTQRDNRKLTLNAQNQPLRDVLLAIAGAFDAKWEKQGEILMLKRNPIVVGEWDDSVFKNFRNLPMPRSDSEELRQFFKEHRFTIPPNLDFEKFEFDIKKFLDEEDFKLDMEKLLKKRGNLFEKFKSLPSSTFSLQNIEKVYESLTPEQIQKHEAHGYLLFDDLTPEQKKMLGVRSNDTHWVVSIARDGKQFTLRSHPK
jgi:hypothetical protein